MASIIHNQPLNPVQSNKMIGFSVTEEQGKLGKQLRELRVEAGLTQEELADLAGTSTRPIYLFENGKASIRLDTYLHLLSVLGFVVEAVPRPVGQGMR